MVFAGAARNGSGGGQAGAEALDRRAERLREFDGDAEVERAVAAEVLPHHAGGADAVAFAEVSVRRDGCLLGVDSTQRGGLGVAHDG